MVSNTVQVRVRHEDDIEGYLLGHFHPDQLQEVEDSMHRWGCYELEGVAKQANSVVSSKYVLGRDGMAFFEIIVA